MQRSKPRRLKTQKITIKNLNKERCENASNSYTWTRIMGRRKAGIY